ncbi:hypothetical protein CSKR_200060, partial [Clonorchis sinensis]
LCISFFPVFCVPCLRKNALEIVHCFCACSSRFVKIQTNRMVVTHLRRPRIDPSSAHSGEFTDCSVENWETEPGNFPLLSF